MPRFYFNLRSSKEFVEDPDGQECESLTVCARRGRSCRLTKSWLRELKSGKNPRRQSVRDHGHHGTAHPDCALQRHVYFRPTEDLHGREALNRDPLDLVERLRVAHAGGSCARRRSGSWRHASARRCARAQIGRGGSSSPPRSPPYADRLRGGDAPASHGPCRLFRLSQSPALARWCKNPRRSCRRRH